LTPVLESVVGKGKSRDWGGGILEVNLDNERINSFGRWQETDGELVARLVVVNGFRDKADSYGQTRLRECWVRQSSGHLWTPFLCRFPAST
jgi:hypothetical protein